MLRILDTFRHYYQMSPGLGTLCQRYFVIGAFDGALTALGMVLASYFAGTLTPAFIIPAALGATIALGLSSAWGAYEAERVVQMQELAKLEKATMRDMTNTVQSKASKFAVIWGAFIHGISPIPAALLPVIAFMYIPPLSIDRAFQISVVSTMTFLFFLGVYLARVGKLNVFTTGARMVVAGIVTAIFCLLVGAAAH